MSENLIDLVNEVSWINETSEYMGDPEIDKILSSVVKLMSKPDVPPAAAAQLIVQLQAYAFKFGTLATWYTNVKKDDRAKKNLYYTMTERTDKMVDALKYVTRNYHG